MMTKRLYRGFLATATGITFALVLIWATGALPAQAEPIIRYVAPAPTGDNQGGSNACVSPSTPCATIQHAIEQASLGDEIRVAGGNFAPGTTVATIDKSVLIIGSWSPDFSAQDPDMYQTVLDAGRNGVVISATNAGDVVLLHLTITKGEGAGLGGGIYANTSNLAVGHCNVTDNVANQAAGSGYGGGIYAINNPGGVIEIWDTDFVSNTAYAVAAASSSGGGGGAYLGGGYVRFEGNRLSYNTAHAWYRGDGGGVYLTGVTSATIAGNSFQSNQGNSRESPYGDYGGGLYISSASRVHVVGNRFYDNRVSGQGGAINIAWSEVHIDRNTFSNNEASSGGAIYMRSNTPVRVSNNLIVNNTGTFRCGGVYVSDYSLPSNAILANNTIADNGNEGIVIWGYTSVTLTNNIVADHGTGIYVEHPISATITADHNLFWNTSDSFTGTAAIEQDPLFLSTYRLSEGSPALDAGVDIPWVTVDLAGRPRSSGQYDLGAYEGAWWETCLPLVTRDS